MSAGLTTPRFSIVAACYQVEQFLDQFFNSLEVQDIADADLEVIVVDDGSTDGTFEVLQRWRQKSRFDVTVLQKSNGGQASARNLGLEYARGEWLTFTDPDDWLDSDYLKNIGAFIDANRSVKQVAAQLVLMHERPDGSFHKGKHPLDGMYDGDRLYNLNVHPDRFSGSAPASFIRADLLREFGLEFDTHIRPNFEDAHLVAKYLLSCSEPLLGLVGSAKYYYRKRGDGSSTLQTSIAQSSRYTVVPERGYLDLLRFGRRITGTTAPEWVQNLVLYDLSWYFAPNEAPSAVVTGAVGAAAEVFVRLLAEITSELSPSVVRSFDVRPLDPKWRQILLHSFVDSDWSTDYVVTEAYDKARGAVRIACRFVGATPAITVLSNGTPVDLSEAKVQSFTYFEHDLLFEWGCWVPASHDLIVLKDTGPMEVRPDWSGPVTYRVSPQQIRRLAATGQRRGGGAGSAKPSMFQKLRTVVSSRRQVNRVVSKYTTIARNLPTRLRLRGANAEFRDAWVLIDRIHNANDSAEVLFRYLREHRPETNAWFTVEEESSDFARIVRDGFGDRLVGYGSNRWKRLMANAAIVVSSHADTPILDPPALRGLTVPRWRRAFLNHGVIKDDLSAWLNPKHLDLFVVSTEDELQSIVGPNTPYRYSGRETKLTGMPRLDSLQHARAALERTGQAKDLVVVAPTWRHWLLQQLKPGSQRRELVDDFEDSDFVRLWSQFVGSHEISDACGKRGLRLVMLPHPNLERALGILEGLSGVEAYSYDRADLQSLFARTALLVTDYSSVAFNIAYLESPTVYFQFDADRMFGGEHVGRKGYFDYPTMGFGPVAHDLDEAVAATVHMIESITETGSVPEPWRSRIETTFPFRDGRCSERVANEILDLLARVGATPS